MHLTWPVITLSASTIALLGKGFISAVRHMPAPLSGSVMYRWLFDTAQDLAGNPDRVGQQRTVPNLPAPAAGEKGEL